MDLKNLIPLLTGHVLDWITFKRVITLFVAAMFGMVVYTIFENRNVLFNSFFTTDSSPVVLTVTVSDRLKQRINEITAQSNEIMVTGVVSADLRTNQRTPVYYYSKNAVIAQLLDDVKRATGATQTIFSSNTESNARMVSVINGEFSCGDMSTTLMAKVVPDLNQHIKSYCFVGLPPYYGDFRGYIVIFTNKVLTAEMTDAIRLELVRLANDVYQEQLNKTVGPYTQ